jgi:uncharacterized OsmC-like protein
VPAPTTPRATELSHRLKALFDEKAETARQGRALHRGHARVRLVHGVACDVEHDDRTLRVDLPATEGGGATGPHPGQLMRASLGACLAMGLRIWAARLEVTVAGVHLDVECEYDPRGQLGVDAHARVGWSRVVFDVVIESAAPEADVLRVVETARALSPMLANLSPSIEQVFRVRVVSAPEQDRLREDRSGTPAFRVTSRP